MTRSNEDIHDALFPLRQPSSVALLRTIPRLKGASKRTFVVLSNATILRALPKLVLDMKSFDNEREPGNPVMGTLPRILTSTLRLGVVGHFGNQVTTLPNRSFTFGGGYARISSHWLNRCLAVLDPLELPRLDRLIVNAIEDTEEFAPNLEIQTGFLRDESQISNDDQSQLFRMGLFAKDEVKKTALEGFSSGRSILGSTWPFWREWYQGFLDGKPLDWELQRRVAMIPDPIWDEGSARVAEEIEKIRALFELEKRIEELEAERAAAETRQDRTGIGGNSPPEPIEDEAKVVEQVTIVWATTGELKEEAKKEQPDKAVFARIIAILAAGLAKIRAFVAKAGAHTALLVYGAAVSSGTTALIQKPELLEAVIEAAKTALPFLH